MTYNEFISKYNGSRIDYDGYAGVQCVDLARLYSREVLENDMGPTPNGYAYGYFAQPTAKVKEIFNLIKNTPSTVPQKGDLAVYNYTLNGEAGHICLCTGEGDTSHFYTYDYNSTGNRDGWKKKDRNYNCILGFLRPKDQTKVLGHTTTVPEKTQSYAKYEVINDTYFRHSPSLADKGVGKLEKGRKLNIVKGFSTKKDGKVWCKVVLNKKEYYVLHKRIKKI